MKVVDQDSEDEARWNPERLRRPSDDIAESGLCFGDSLRGELWTRPLSSLTSSDGSIMSWKMLIWLSVRRHRRASLPDWEEIRLAAMLRWLPTGEIDSLAPILRPSLLITNTKLHICS